MWSLAIFSPCANLGNGIFPSNRLHSKKGMEQELWYMVWWKEFFALKWFDKAMLFWPYSFVGAEPLHWRMWSVHSSNYTECLVKQGGGTYVYLVIWSDSPLKQMVVLKSGYY